MLPLIGAGVSLLTGIATGISSSVQKKKAEDRAKREFKEREKRLDDYYSQEIGTDVLDTSAAQSTLAMLRRQNDKAVQAVGNNTVRSSATPEAKIALASKLNENYASAASQIAGNGEARRQQLEQMRFNAKDQIKQDAANLDYNSAMGKADAIQQWGSLASDSIGMATSLYGDGLFGKSNSGKKSNSGMTLTEV